ncbi:hypothetical protein ANAPC5_01095 [Anaplasma phagocytophilum]|nr:hypothetical protein ANAPC5_01095 [Anaplasma phagocytophilum]
MHDVSAMGRNELGSFVGLPGLGIGTTIAERHSEGMLASRHARLSNSSSAG